MNDQIVDYGRGPQIKGSRITVYDIIPYLEGEPVPKAEIAEILCLSSEQLDAALAYIDEHRDEVMAVHRQIEERHARGNPPEIQQRLEQTHRRFERFRAWLIQRQQTKNGDVGSSGVVPLELPDPESGARSLKELWTWFAEREAKEDQEERSAGNPGGSERRGLLKDSDSKS